MINIKINKNELFNDEDRIIVIDLVDEFEEGFDCEDYIDDEGLCPECGGCPDCCTCNEEEDNVNTYYININLNNGADIEQFMEALDKIITKNNFYLLNKF